MNNPIAQRRFAAIAPNGQEILLHVKIGAPYKVSINEWKCPVVIEGYTYIIPDMPGVDSWGALREAYKIIIDLLGNFLEGGGRLFLSDLEVTSDEITKYF